MPSIHRLVSLAVAVTVVLATGSVAAGAKGYLPPLPRAVALRLSASAATGGLVITAPVPHAAALSRRVRAAILVARATWGSACENHLAVRWADYDDTLGAARGGGRVLARAHDCAIDFSRRVLDDDATRTWAYAWPWLCTLVVHEYGHLAGQGHSTDQNSVMYPSIDRVFWRCRD
jgi:hypothetical protein